MKENKGITLVALVITIIILLILAGITMGILMNTGLFKKTQKAKQENNIAQVVENLKLKVMEVQTEKEGSATLIDFVQYLSKDDNETYVISLTKTASIQGEIPDLTNAKMIYVTYKNVECKVDEFLNVEYSASITSNRDESSTLKECSRYIDVNVKKGIRKFELSVDIPDTDKDKVEKIQYYVDDKKVYEGIEKKYTVEGIQSGKEYEFYAIVTYRNEKISKKVTAMNVPDADIYVSVDGNNETGNGTVDKPYASLAKAITMASNGNSIYVMAGEYNLEPMTSTTEYAQAGIYDQGKKLIIYGDNEKTILKYNGKNSALRDGPALTLENSNTIVRNLTYEYEPKLYIWEGDQNIGGAIFDGCFGTVENVFFRIVGENKAIYLYNNNQDDISKPANNVLNCTFFHDLNSVGANYSGRCNFTNIATNVNTNGTNTNVIVKSFGNAQDSIQNLIEKSKNDSEFNSEQVGVFYGEHAWSK